VQGDGGAGRTVCGSLARAAHCWAPFLRAANIVVAFSLAIVQNQKKPLYFRDCLCPCRPPVRLTSNKPLFAELARPSAAPSLTPSSTGTVSKASPKPPGPAAEIPGPATPPPAAEIPAPATPPKAPVPAPATPPKAAIPGSTADPPVAEAEAKSPTPPWHSCPPKVPPPRVPHPLPHFVPPPFNVFPPPFPPPHQPPFQFPPVPPMTMPIPHMPMPVPTAAKPSGTTAANPESGSPQASEVECEEVPLTFERVGAQGLCFCWSSVYIRREEEKRELTSGSEPKALYPKPVNPKPYIQT